MSDSDGHIRPSKVLLGVNGSDGLILGFAMPGDTITTYWISIDDARNILKELPNAIAQAEKARA